MLQHTTDSTIDKPADKSKFEIIVRHPFEARRSRPRLPQNPLCTCAGDIKSVRWRFCLHIWRYNEACSVIRGQFQAQDACCFCFS